MIKIRNYEHLDYSQVKEILEKSCLYWDPVDNERSLEKKIKMDQDSIILALDDNQIVGTQIVVLDYFPFLFRLAVHPDYRKRGIGTMLMKKGEEVIKSKGFNHVNILVAAEENELQEIYERLGYEKGNKYVWMTKEFK